MEKILMFERDWFLGINHSHTPFMDALMWLFSGVPIWCPLVLVPLYFLLRRREDCLPACLAIGLILLLCCLIPACCFKPLFVRFRPTSHPLFMEQVVLLYNYTADGPYGFISGHTTSAFGFAGLSIRLVKNRVYTVLILVWAGLMAYSRIYLGAHFISDVAGGCVVGVLLGWLVYRLYVYAGRRWFQLNEPVSGV
jgi:undecaprenyl-diphosphatase